MPGACPQCGQSLSASPDAHPVGAASRSAAPDVSASEPEAAESALIADLREAYGFDAAARRPNDATHTHAEAPEGSTAFVDVLSAAALPPRHRLGDFEIIGELGRGGMGVVYRARQLSLGRDVALKVLPGYTRHGQASIERFRTEAQAAARVHHTNVVPIYAQGEHDGHYYYAMELIEGVSLDTVIRSHPDLISTTRARGGSSSVRLPDRPPRVPEQESEAKPVERPPEPEPPAATDESPWTREDFRHLAALVAEVADALSCAHEQGVIHRDVKPHNLLLDDSATHLHLTDFGLARLTHAPHLTVSGEVMGTPSYLSPEQVKGDVGHIDHRTDIYSLGVTLYELLTRRKAFEGETREQIISGICSRDPVPPRRVNPTIPRDLETICLRAMQKNAADRHPNAAALAEDLRRFADGRPILSRRATPVELAIKWIRRHKTLTTAVAASIAAIVLATGLGLHVRATRLEEARRMLDDAYEQLAYVDYRHPDALLGQLEEASRRGTDPHLLHLARGLVAMSETDYDAAKEHFGAATRDDADDLRAWYLLSWAQSKSDGVAALATFEQAERSGPPRRADAWFYRGLAIHFDDAAMAIDSYRQANALRARKGEFYPQAVLHLARARNQQMYASRTIDPFLESEAGLRQLIEQQHYGAYPYYLLSIAHRLAAEIYAGSTGTRDDSLVDYHYSQALDAARRGQQVDPENDRSVVAEAECLESMGRIEDALAARTRAISLARRPWGRCESLHYRWRLHYWTGNLDAAREDVVQHAECDPENIFYTHVYPALILAESGEMDAARDRAMTLADEIPTDALAIIWSAATLRLLGEPAMADELLATRADTVDFTRGWEPLQDEGWLRALYAHCRFGDRLETLEALAARTDTPWKLWGEAHFHTALLHLSNGDRTTCIAELQHAYRSFDGAINYTYHARLLMGKMQQNSSWPPWIDVSWGGEVPGS